MTSNETGGKLEVDPVVASRVVPGIGLVTFLTARLDEEHRNTEDALAQWPDTHFTIDPGSLVIVRFHREHAPARVMREVEAKRKILAEHSRTVNAYISGHGFDNPYCARCVDSDRDGDYYAEEPGPCPTVRAVASVYSDHPDYQAGWLA